MKHVFLRVVTTIGFLMALILTTSAQTNVNLIITKTDGEEQVIQVTEESHVFFENGTHLVIEDGTGTTLRFVLSEMRKIVCDDTTTEIQEDSISMQIFPNPLHDSFVIKGVHEKCAARIYALDGRLMKTIEASDGTVIDMSDMHPGIYILSIDGKTLKMIKL